MYFSFRLNIGEHDFNHVNEFVSVSELLQSWKDKIPINCIKGFDTSFMSRIVEWVCKIVLSFLIESEWLPPIFKSNVFCSWFLRMLYVSVVSNIIFITFFVYDRNHSYSGNNTHGAKVTSRLINYLKIYRFYDLK